MAVQSTYNETMDAARAGMRANMEPVDLISRTVETAAGVGFGKVVQQGTADKGCKSDLTGMTAQTYVGITMRERGVRPETPNAFAQYESALIMRKGVIWVEVAVAVTPADIVTVTLASGVIGKTAVGAGVVAIPNARWESSTSGAGLAMLRLG
ncbi:structural cement protein Gp24 [Aurantimonas sp. NFXS3]|uniref:structural cement protein Gp24 n=1 Tax=Aurantimonas sp. NFXS3 TaxID=2818434 RepID=UPI003B8CF693